MRKSARKNGRRNGKGFLARSTLRTLRQEHFKLGRTWVSSWDAWLVIIFALALVVNILAGALQESEELLILPLPVVEASQNLPQGADGSPPVITSLSSSGGPSGTRVTIHGSGFSAVDNVIYFGVDIVASIPSTDGRTLSFVVPSIPSDVYFVGVITVSGVSNIINFSVE